MSWPPDESSSRRPRISRRPDESQAAPRQGDSRQDNGRRDFRENRGTPRQGEFRRDFRADSGAPRTPYQRDDRSASRPERPYPRAERGNAYQEPQERNLSLSMGDADSAPQTAVGGMREVEELLRNDPSRVHRVLTTYRDLRQPGERFIDAVRRIGLDPFKEAGKAARHPVEAEEEALA